MKKIITMLSVVLPLYTCAQVSFTFENGTADGWTFGAPDRWVADGVSPLNGKYSLRHIYDNSVAGVDVALFSIAGLCPECSDITWEFTVRHGTDPSSSNRWAFILASDSGPETIMTGGGFNGFAAGVNFSGYDDTLRLWQVTGEKIETVITSGVNWQTDVGVDRAAKVRVTRAAGGVWKMEVEALSKGQGAWNLEEGAESMWLWSGSKDQGEGEGEGSTMQVTNGSANDEPAPVLFAVPLSEIANNKPLIPIPSSGIANSKSQMADQPGWKWSGIIYTYTSTRDRLLWLDDVSVEGVFIADTLPPDIVSVTFPAPDLLRVQFDEEPDPSSLVPSNISLAGGVEITSITKMTPEVYEFHLGKEPVNRISSILTFRNLCDNNGNCASQLTHDFIPVFAVTGDVVISEIMADPSPPVQLPDAEYIELSNLIPDSLSLRDWILIADDDTVRFPDIRIRGGEHLILCSSTKTSGFTVYGRVIGLTGFPSLNDSGETLALRDGRGGLIHAVTYSKSCYRDEWRSGGGWSMELTDSGNPFNAPEAWRASTDPSGGTPGRPGSQAVKASDSRCPEIIAVYPVSPVRVRILFDETVIGALAVDKWLTDGHAAVSSVSDDIADRAFLIGIVESLVNGRIYTLEIPGSAADFAGNYPCRTEVQFGLPESPAAGEILFNELLFDPLPPCVDYLEIYNNSDKIIDLSQLFLAGSGPGLKSSAREGWTSGPGLKSSAREGWTSGPGLKSSAREGWTSGPGLKSSAREGWTSGPGLKSSVPAIRNSTAAIRNTSAAEGVSAPFLSHSAALAVSQIPRQLLPGKLVALTTDRNAVADQYPCSEKQAVYEVRSLPSMPDDEGTIIILDRTMSEIDRVDYSSSMHQSILDTKKGIALEKVGPELSSGFVNNWHSASEACGWGTPGAPNSVLVNEAPEGRGLCLSSERVSPDGDGFEDAVSVRVTPGGNDNVVTVTVFNARGYPVRRLAERFFAGEEAVFIWDGTGDGGSGLDAGLYMIIAESYDSRGRTWRGKKVCAVLYR